MTPYDFGISSPRFSTPWADFPAALNEWFESEELVRINPDLLPYEGLATRDPFLAGSLRLLRLKWGAEQWTAERLLAELSALPEDDFTVAAYEYFGRKQPQLLANISQPNIAAFFGACQVTKSDDAGLKAAIKHLHARKNASYAGSWKRRGERVSVLPNIARKVDRLQAFADEGLTLEGETVLDTAIDLYVYAAKYRLFLAELPGADIAPLGPGAPQPFSDYDENFNILADAAAFGDGRQGEFVDHIRAIVVLFENLWQAVDSDALLPERQRRAAELAVAAEQLVGIMTASDQANTSAFIRHER
jgi:thymidylate synthase